MNVYCICIVIVETNNKLINKIDIRDTITENFCVNYIKTLINFILLRVRIQIKFRVDFTNKIFVSGSGPVYNPTRAVL